MPIMKPGFPLVLIILFSPSTLAEVPSFGPVEIQNLVQIDSSFHQVRRRGLATRSSSYGHRDVALRSLNRRSNRGVVLRAEDDGQNAVRRPRSFLLARGKGRRLDSRPAPRIDRVDRRPDPKPHRRHDDWDRRPDPKAHHDRQHDDWDRRPDPKVRRDPDRHADWDRRDPTPDLQTDSGNQQQPTGTLYRFQGTSQPRGAAAY